MFVGNPLPLVFEEFFRIAIKSVIALHECPAHFQVRDPLRERGIITSVTNKMVADTIQQDNEATPKLLWLRNCLLISVLLLNWYPSGGTRRRVLQVATER